MLSLANPRRMQPINIPQKKKATRDSFNLSSLITDSPVHQFDNITLEYAYIHQMRYIFQLHE